MNARTLLAAMLAAGAFLTGACEQAHDPHAGHDHAEEDAHAGHDHGAAGDQHDEDHDERAAEEHADEAPTGQQGADDHAGHEHADEDEHDHEGEDEHHDEDIIRADDATLAEFGVTLAEAGPGAIRSEIGLTGEVILAPDGVAHITARAGGIVSSVSGAVGDRVEAGQLLATLESTELAEAKAELLARAGEAQLARTDLERAETIHTNTGALLDLIAGAPTLDELRAGLEGLDIGADRSDLITAYARSRAAEAAWLREKTLREREISSEAEYIEAESAFKTSWAGFQAARDDLAFRNRRELEAARRAVIAADIALAATEQRLHGLGLDEEQVVQVRREDDLELARHTVDAPIAGLIIARHAVRGERIEAGDQLFIVADLSTVWVQLSVYQKDLAALRAGMPVRITAAHGGAEADATIDYISPILDPHTRAAAARIVLPNPDGQWRPGAFVGGRVTAGAGEAAVAVPAEALQRIDGQQVIFVQTPEGIEPRAVRTGRAAAGVVEILEGLAPGETFAATGALALKAELDKAALEHAGHAH